MNSICTYQHFYGDSKICFLFEIFQMCSFVWQNRNQSCDQLLISMKYANYFNLKKLLNLISLNDKVILRNEMKLLSFLHVNCLITVLL